MKRLQVLLLRVVLLLVAVGCIAGALLLLLNTYDDFTFRIASGIGQSHKLQKFRELLLTRDRFFLLRIISLISVILTVGMLPFLWKRAVDIPPVPDRLMAYSKSRIKSYISFWQALPMGSKYSTGILFVLILLSRACFVFRFPFHVDERFTYLYFVDKGIAVSMAYYPGPNNHILYTLICNLFNIFITDPVLVMKLPALLIGLGLSVIFWIVVSRYFTYPVALLATALFSFAEPVFYYSMQGRGYALLMLFVLLATHSAIQINRCNKHCFLYFLWFWLGCTLGFYTIPVFLYPFVSLLIFIGLHLLVQREYRTFKRLLLTTVAVSLSVAILYLPVIVFNGWDALAGNSWVSPMPWKEYLPLLPQHMLELASGLWGIFPGGVWLTGLSLLFCLGGVLSKKTAAAARPWMELYLINLTVLLSMSFLQRLLLPVRVLFYLSIYQYVIMAYAGSKIVQSIYTRYQFYFREKQLTNLQKLPRIPYAVRLLGVLFLSLVYIALSVYNFYLITKPGQFPAYQSFDATAQWLFRRQANNIFVNDYDYSLCIRFLYETNGQEIQLYTNQPEPGKPYHYLVIYPGHLFPVQIPLNQYTRVYADGQVIVYKKSADSQ
jgi:hypothetical protein